MKDKKLKKRADQGYQIGFLFLALAILAFAGRDAIINIGSGDTFLQGQGVTAILVMLAFIALYRKRLLRIDVDRIGLAAPFDSDPATFPDSVALHQLADEIAHAVAADFRASQNALDLFSATVFERGREYSLSIPARPLILISA